MGQTPACFCVDHNDNVATLLVDAVQGPVSVFGAGEVSEMRAVEPVAAGHKIALRPIADGEAVMKYGVAIGLATRPIRAGEWVHLHNCRSAFDERSSTLDAHTGAPTDTRYE